MIEKEKKSSAKLKKGEKYTFFTLFLSELRNIYDAEVQQKEIYKEIISEVVTKELRKKLQKQEVELIDQIRRLDHTFESLEQISSGVTCKVMKSFISEMKDVLKNIPASEIKDSAIIAALQRMKHYEIACYGTVRNFAKQLNNEKLSDEFTLSLKEEKETDQQLSSIAEGGFFTTGVNKLASRVQAPLIK